MQTTPEYIPTKGDLCYVIGKTSRWGNSANRSYGAIVRIDKVRINYRRNRKDEVSSATIEVSGIEGYRGGVDESNWKADFSAELMPVNWATPEQIKEYADARAKRADEDAQAAKKRQEAEAFEAEFKAKHMAEVMAPTVFGEVIERKQNNDRYTFRCVRPYKRFKGQGLDVTIEDCEEETHVSLRWQVDRWDDDMNAGRWLFEYASYLTVDAAAMEAHIRCAMAAQAKLAELTQAQMVAA